MKCFPLRDNLHTVKFVLLGTQSVRLHTHPARQPTPPPDPDSVPLGRAPCCCACSQPLRPRAGSLQTQARGPVWPCSLGRWPGGSPCRGARGPAAPVRGCAVAHSPPGTRRGLLALPPTGPGQGAGDCEECRDALVPRVCGSPRSGSSWGKPGRGTSSCSGRCLFNCTS